VLGFRGVGKSALIARLVDNRFLASHEPTIEYTFRTTLVHNSIHFACDILDTSAQDEYSSLSRQACIGVHGYVLVYSITSRISYENIKVVHEKLTSVLCGSSIPMILVATKCDWDEYREVSTTEGQTLARMWDCPFLECSAKADIHVEKVFYTLLAAVEKQSGFLPKENKETCTLL
jgi:Ras family protein